MQEYEGEEAGRGMVVGIAFGYGNVVVSLKEVIFFFGYR